VVRSALSIELYVNYTGVDYLVLKDRRQNKYLNSFVHFQSNPMWTKSSVLTQFYTLDISVWPIFLFKS